jgi:hypothetical protein
MKEFLRSKVLLLERPEEDHVGNNREEECEVIIIIKW